MVQSRSRIEEFLTKTAFTNRLSSCALGAAFETRHHPRFITFPKSLSDFFADRAKALLDIELDCPSVATVQAMVILSGHDIGCKRDARGWLYSGMTSSWKRLLYEILSYGAGMAMRLAFDLALHVNMTQYVERGLVSQAEADLRKTVFWGAYTVDQYTKPPETEKKKQTNTLLVSGVSILDGRSESTWKMLQLTSQEEGPATRYLESGLRTFPPLSQESHNQIMPKS